MFVSGFNIEVSFQSTVEEHYFDIKERDFIVREGTDKLFCLLEVLLAAIVLLSGSGRCMTCGGLYCVIV